MSNRDTHSNNADTAARNSWIGRLRTAEPQPPWGFFDLISTLVALALAMLIVAPAAALLLGGEEGALSAGALLTGWSVGLFLVAAFVLIARRRTEEQLAALQLNNRPLLPLPLVLLLGVAAALTFDLVAVAGLGGQFNVTAELRAVTSTELVFAVLLMVIAQPVAHGLVFAGVLLPTLRAQLGPVPGYMATVALFGIYYFAVYGATLTGSDQLWHGIIVPLLTGAFILAVRLRTASTRAAIIAEAGVGLTAIGVALALGL